MGCPLGFSMFAHLSETFLQNTRCTGAGLNFVSLGSWDTYRNSQLYAHLRFRAWNKLNRNISAHNAYSESDVSKIVSYANANGLEVIPLVQTFGHLEMALKLDEFKTLREAAGHPQVIHVKTEYTHFFFIRDFMIWKTSCIPLNFQIFDSFCPLLHPLFLSTFP